MAGGHEIGDLAVRRIRASRRRRLVVAGGRIVEEIRIDRSRVVVLVPVDQVGLDAGHRIELLLEPDAALPVVRIAVAGAAEPLLMRIVFVTTSGGDATPQSSSHRTP